MKTKFTSLVTVKKNSVQKSESIVEDANATLKNASNALKISIQSLDEIDAPQSGTMNDFLASRTLLDLTRTNIQYNKEWLEFATTQLNAAKEQLKLDMVEYEKFKYLDLEEIKKILQKQKMLEAKELDEVALMTHARKNNRKKG